MIRRGKAKVVATLFVVACLLGAFATTASAIPTVKSTFVFTKAAGDTYTGKVKSSVKACTKGRTVVFKRGPATIATKTSSKSGKVVLTPADQTATPFELAHVAMKKKKIGNRRKRFCAADQATIDKRGDERSVSFVDGSMNYDGDKTFSASIESVEPQCINQRGAQLYQDLTPRGPGTSDSSGFISVTIASLPGDGSWILELTDAARWYKISGKGGVNSGPCETQVTSPAIVFP